MDKIVSIIAALCIPGLVLLVAVSTTGLAGGAAIVAALAALGGPLGMVGGLGVLGILVIIAKGLSEFGFDKIYKAVVKNLLTKGETKESILKKIETYPLSKELKKKLRELLGDFGSDTMQTQE